MILLSRLPSGPLSCLCSEVAACEYSADNEVDVLPSIFQVKIFKQESFSFKIFRKRTVESFVPPTLSVATTLGIVRGRKKREPYISLQTFFFLICMVPQAKTT